MHWLCLFAETTPGDWTGTLVTAGIAVVTTILTGFGYLVKRLLDSAESSQNRYLASLDSLVAEMKSLTKSVDESTKAATAALAEMRAFRETWQPIGASAPNVPKRGQHQ